MAVDAVFLLIILILMKPSQVHVDTVIEVATLACIL